MKKQPIILLCALFLICGSATAQFKKALPNTRGNGQVNDAKVNIGLLGGGNYTTWFHVHRLKAADWYLANYKPKLTFGYFGGIAVEYMLLPYQSVGLNVVYAQHNMGLKYLNENFPIGVDQYISRTYDLTANYRAIEAYVPVTFYINIGSKSLKPYFYVAPRASYILDGQMNYNRTDTDADGHTTTHSPEQVPFDTTNYKKFNIGATAGVGTQFKINTANYYLLLKFDLSANANFIQTYTKYDLMNEFNYMRYSADAYATLTFMLPIKKRLIGACVKWGKYD